ncbi:hypothetical protein C8F01DRAFT_261915 [Mycena amicta]|nr:hypothetical protein C8F01DRAFT_261915 [Mycena amicta]
MIQESITLASRSASTRETANVPNTPSRRRNPRCKPRGQPQTTSDGDATSVPGSKETTVGHVVVTESGAMKYEPEDDELGPEYPVPEECRDATYSREQISKVLGGGPITTTHHWTKNVQNRTESITGNTKPFITFSREWHPSLPTHPGGHGTAVGNLFIKSPDNPQPVPVFVREKKNHWRPMGIYDGQKVGIITPEGIARMSRDIVDTWSHAIATKSWGKARIEEANDNLLKNQRKIVRTKEDIRAALGDGRLKLHFTVLKCVGYPHDWFKSLEDYRKKEEREKQVKGEEVDEDDEEEEEEEDIFRGTPTREMPRSTSSRKRKTRHWAAAAEVKSEPDDSDDSDFEFEAVKKRPRRQR